MIGRIYIGIDPGGSGGIAALEADGSVVQAVRTPESDRDILDVLLGVTCESTLQCFAVIEHVWSSPGMGVSSASKFGGSIARLRMALTACNIPYDQATPQRWQKAIGGLASAPTQRTDGKGFRKARDKNVSKARAQQLFPHVKVTHALADALLIAEYCRRVRLGIAPAPEPATPKPKRVKPAATEALF